MKLLLLHGALNNGAQFSALQEYLRTKKVVSLAPTFPGHESESSKKFDFFQLQEFTKNTIIAEEPTHIIGYSLGGYLALCAAAELKYANVNVITIGTKINWTLDVFIKQTSIFDTTVLQQKHPHLLLQWEGLFGTELESVLNSTKTLLEEIQVENRLCNPMYLSQIMSPVSLCRGTKDKLVSAEETEELKSNLANAKYFEIESLPHDPIGVNWADFLEKINLLAK